MRGGGLGWGWTKELSRDIVNIAKTLRKRATDAEKLIWRHLRAARLEGLKFRRQHPIGDYVVDFVCLEKQIVIEVDGGQHATEREKDKARDKWLKGEGFKVLRFWNNEVLKNIEGVLETIRRICLSHPPLTPPLKGGETKGAPTEKSEEPFIFITTLL